MTFSIKKYIMYSYKTKQVQTNKVLKINNNKTDLTKRQRSKD